MSRKALIVHGVVAIIALFAAYSAWKKARQGDTDGDTPEESSVVVAELQRSEIKGISYRSEKRNVVIDLSSADGPRWVTVSTKTKVRRPQPEKTKVAPQPDAGVSPDAGAPTPIADAGITDAAEADAAPSEPDAPPEPEFDIQEKVVRFAANKVLDELLEKVAPLKAVRRLGKLQPSQLEEFELHEPHAQLEISLASGKRVLQVGARTFGGGNHYYVLDEHSGESFLLGSRLIRDLEMAQSRLFQRELHDFEDNEVASAIIIAAGRRRALEHRNRQSPRDHSWVDPENPEDSAELLGNWMRQLGRLRVLAYPEPGQGPDASAPPLMRIELSGDDGAELGYLEIFRGAAETPEFFGRSEATGTWVQLSRTVSEQVVQDLEEVLGD